MRVPLCPALFLCAALAACSPNPADDAPDLDRGPEAEISEFAGDDIPASVVDLAGKTVPGMKVDEAERKARDGMVFWDVEGTRPDGSEVELDILDQAGVLTVVEIQRDLAWETVPAPVRAAAEARSGMFVPARVIESTQQDGTVIFELFREGQPREPAVEIALKDGKAAFLTERNKY